MDKRSKGLEKNVKNLKETTKLAEVKQKLTALFVSLSHPNVQWISTASGKLLGETWVRTSSWAGSFHPRRGPAGPRQGLSRGWRTHSVTRGVTGESCLTCADAQLALLEGCSGGGASITACFMGRSPY